MGLNLALYTTAGISACERFYLIDRYQVEVTIDSVLQSRSSHSKLEGLTLCWLGEQTMDQTT